MHLDANLRRRGGVTLVELVVHNPEEEPRRVRVANRLDGDLWPPRSHGDPLPAWDDDGATVRVAPGGRRPLGYASPAPPSDPAAEIASVAEVDRDDGPSEDAGSAAAVFRDLGDPRPPRDAVGRSPPAASALGGGQRVRHDPAGSGR